MNRWRTHSQASVRLSDPVSRGPIRLQSTSRCSITFDSSRAAETIRWTSGLLAFAPTFSFSAAQASDAITNPVPTTHPTQKRPLMPNLHRMTDEDHTHVCGLTRVESASPS